VTGFCHRTSVRKMPPATFRDILKVLESDFSDSSKDDVSMSQEDVQFLSTLDATTIQVPTQAFGQQDIGRKKTVLP